MFAKIQWTPEQDKIIIEGRKQRKSWGVISKELGYCANTVCERGNVLGTKKPSSKEYQRLSGIPNEPTKISNRPPLPAGHPVFWKLICPNYEFPNLANLMD